MANRERVTDDPSEQYFVVMDTCHRYMTTLENSLATEYMRFTEAKVMIVRMRKLKQAYKNRKRVYNNRNDLDEKEYKKAVSEMMFVIHEIMKTIQDTKRLIYKLTMEMEDEDES